MSRILQCTSAFHRSCYGLLISALLASLNGCGSGTPPAAPAGEKGATHSPATNSPTANAATQQSATPVTNGSNAAATTNAALTARQLLEKVAAAYRNSSTYADQGYVRRRFVRAGQEYDLTMPFQITWQKPNKLRLECYTVKLANDGEFVRGAIRDVDGVMQLPAPAALTRDIVVVDQLMQQELNFGFAGNPLQLLLLFADDALPVILQNKQEPKFRSEERHENQLCHRVELDSPQGPLVIWIDQKSLAVRRLDFPLQELQAGLAKDGPISNLEMYADFVNARLNEPLPKETFQFEIPAGALTVKRLLPQPPPLPPTPLLGKKAPPFDFIAADGTHLTPESLQGKIAVLIFWAAPQPLSRDLLPLLDQAAKKYATTPDKIAFIAVAVDDAAVSDATIRDQLAAWKATIPFARDPRSDAKKSLGVEGIPSLWVLGPDGVVEHHWPALPANLVDALPRVLDLLITGESTHERTLAEYQQLLAEYRRIQQTPPDLATQTVTEIPLPTAQVAPVGKPTAHRLRTLWIISPDELRQPGNILVVNDSPTNAAETTNKAPPDNANANGAPRILILDGWQAVCEYSPAGKLIKRHELQLPPRTAVTTMRTALDGRGKRIYALFHGFEKQVFVYDENWQRVLTFPSVEQQGQDVITDVQLGDLDGDGNLELIAAYSGISGVKAADLRGKLLWSNRKDAQLVFRVALSSPAATGKRTLFCSTGQGVIVPLDAAGNAAEPLVVPGVRIFGIYGGGPEQAALGQFLGYAPTPEGKNTLVALDPNGRALWNYELPTGVPQTPIDFVTAAPIGPGQTPYWLLAGPDGSVHWISTAGQTLERFATGQVLTGLAGLYSPEEQQTLIVIAGATGVEAKVVEPLETASSRK